MRRGDCPLWIAVCAVVVYSVIIRGSRFTPRSQVNRWICLFEIYSRQASPVSLDPKSWTWAKWRLARLTWMTDKVETHVRHVWDMCLGWWVIVQLLQGERLKYRYLKFLHGKQKVSVCYFYWIKKLIQASDNRKQKVSVLASAKIILWPNLRKSHQKKYNISSEQSYCKW